MRKSSYIKKDNSFLEDVSFDAIKTISNANRYAIMRLLFNVKKDICVNEISEKVGISQSATSHQLAYLEAKGVVKGIRMSKTKCYIPTNSLLAKKINIIINSLKLNK